MTNEALQSTIKMLDTSETLANDMFAFVAHLNTEENDAIYLNTNGSFVKVYRRWVFEYKPDDRQLAISRTKLGNIEPITRYFNTDMPAWTSRCISVGS